MKRWVQGERCRVKCRGRTFDAVVHIVSSNGQPLAVGGYDGIIEGFVNWCPIIWFGEDSRTFTGESVVIEQPPAHDTLADE